MAIIEWNDRISVNVAEIDNQHKKLIDLINELDIAMKSRKANDVIEKILSGLADYAKTHFQTEENYFARLKYPDTQAHKNEHTAFIKKVTAFKKDFDAGKSLVSVEVLNFLSQWLWNHIKGSDKKYSAFFNEKGVR